MYSITVRKLLIDLESGFGRHWGGGDAFLTHYHNALSFSFPVGEQFFIDSVRDASKLLPATAEHADLHRAVALFIGQEATHRHLHGIYNKKLQSDGLINHWGPSATKKLQVLRGRTSNPLHALALTSAFEHLTALFADVVLRHPQILAKAEPKMRTLWLWHASEETEHNAVAFDLYRALGGSYQWRILWYFLALYRFSIECVRQTTSNLWRDGVLFKVGTWRDAATFIWGRNGMLWLIAMPLLRYLKRDFHPSLDKQSPTAQELAASWLQAHQDAFRELR